MPQTPDEKAQLNKPAMPQVPTTISHNIETPLSATNFSQFRSLQRGTTGVSAAWQETSTFRPNSQFRSLQRGGAAANAQFRTVKIQDQRGGNTVPPVDSMYSNNESERQLYAVTEL